MKYLNLILSILTLSTAAVAQADLTIQLANIDTDNCERAQSVIQLLNSSNRIAVDAVCSPYSYQGYPSNNGRSYNYRLTTTVTLFGEVASGTIVEFAAINTDRCNFVRDEVNLLNSVRASVHAECSPYSKDGYASNNGTYYDYRVYSSITIQ